MTKITDLSALTGASVDAANDVIPVVDVSETGAARNKKMLFAELPTGIGLGTGNSPQFTAVNIGHATDTTVSRASAGDLAVEGNIVYRAGGADVPVTDGGTGASTAAGARTNLGATTVGANIFTLTNPSAITFLRMNADNTVTALDAASFRTAIGAGAGGGSIGGASGSTDNALIRADGTGGSTIQSSVVTVSDSGAFTFPDGVTQVFNPDGTNAGLNVGAQAGDPSSLTNGDVWYNSSSNALKARINGATVSLGAGGSGSAWFLQWGPLQNEPPASNYATFDTRNSRAVLDFDTTTQEGAVFSGILPAGYGGNGVTVSVWVAMTSATSGTVGFDVAIERCDTSSLDIDADSFASAQTITATTVPGTSGQVLKLSVNISNGANMDSLAAGELFRLRIRRDVANDTATGDAELLRVMMVEQ